MSRCDSSLKLPIIDFTKENLKPGSSQWDQTSNEVLKAFEEYGCFEALYDKSSVELQNEIYERMDKMFDLPREVKCKYTSPKPYYGYNGNVPDMPLYEAVGIDDALSPQVIPTFTNITWPEANPTFCELLEKFTKKIADFEKMVRLMVLYSLRVEKYFDSQDEDIAYTLRLSKYGAPMTEEPKVGARSHFDKNFVSILCENLVAGLEVQRRDGKWLKASIPPSSLVVMTGESFLGWSNGRLHCPLHQVMMTGNKPRYSLGIFSSMKGRIEVPKELVNEEHPLLFKPFDEIGLLKVLNYRVYPENSEASDLYFAETVDLSIKAYAV